MSTRARRGFTLMEGVVALAIVGVTSVAALEGLGAELRAAARARHVLDGEALARERLAAMRLLPPAQLERLPEPAARGAFAAPFAGYAWTASARRLPAQPGLHELRVRVAWDGGAYALASRHFVAPARWGF